MIERKVFETTISGKKLTVEFNNIAQQANGSVLVRLGDTMVFSTAVMSRMPKDTMDFFPLVVDYEEKYYAAGRILGSRFVRREGRPSQEAILTSRLIDRTIRPLFDHRLRYEIQIVASTLSLDEEHSPDIIALFAASVALITSNIPWGGPASAVRVCKLGEKFVLNPTYAERMEASLDLVVCGAGGYINMLEGKGKEVSEEDFLKASEVALDQINELNAFQETLAREVGKEKIVPTFEEAPEEAKALLKKHFIPRLQDALYTTDKKAREHTLSDLKQEWIRACAEQFPEFSKGGVSDLYEDAINDIVHENILTADKRPDGRKPKEIRPLFAEVGTLSRTHGSGLFYRGDTHILSAVTLGAPGDELLIEGMEVQTKKHFMHHYNFPPFSVGEVGRMGSPGRREIGHGSLAEKSLEAIIPPKEVFPYTIRIVSETMSSNGSSSMGSVCASTVALMDAGVPIIRPAAGIAMGLMMSDDTTYKVLTDIQGPEDHHGDMDFKAAGTEKGVTGVQMDVKIKGITLPMLKDALADAREARLFILKTLTSAISEPRATLSPYAPRIIHISIPVDKIRDVIGPGGKVINEIIAETGAQIDIEQTGDIYITGTTEDSARKAEEIVKSITKEFTVGETVSGKVSRIFDFGAMIEFAPKQEGLVHISELANFRVGKVTDIVNIGDVVNAKIIGIDDLGRVNLSMKALLPGASEQDNHERPQDRNHHNSKKPNHRPRS